VIELQAPSATSRVGQERERVANQNEESHGSLSDSSLYRGCSEPRRPWNDAGRCRRMVRDVRSRLGKLQLFFLCSVHGDSPRATGLLPAQPVPGHQFWPGLRWDGGTWEHADKAIAAQCTSGTARERSRSPQWVCGLPAGLRVLRVKCGIAYFAQTPIGGHRRGDAPEILCPPGIHRSDGAFPAGDISKPVNGELVARKPRAPNVINLSTDVPVCPRCLIAMRVADFVPHARLSQTTVVVFDCGCGETARRHAAHTKPNGSGVRG
jgi:hypothetical protein